MRKAATLPPTRPPARGPADPEVTVGIGVAAALYFGLALVYFLPALLPERMIFGTDYLAGGYFFYNFISDRIAAGALPKWVPYVYGGLPLFANPGSTYYPVHLLADLLLPTHKVLAVVFVFQFWIAGVGMYLLARDLGCRAWVAFVAGLAFQFTGITASWVYAGHDGRVIVATFAPLLFFFLHRGIRTGRISSFGGAAATVGFALLSFQIQNAYYLLLSAAIWSTFCLLHLSVGKRPAVMGKLVSLGIGAVAFGFLLAAVNFLPFLDYVSESPRGEAGGRGYAFSVSFSMPPQDLVGLAVPEHRGVSVSDPMTGASLFPSYRGPNAFKLHTEYVGALVLVLVALGVGTIRGNRYWWFFLGLGAFFLTLALGGHTPLYRAYYEVLPGLKRFRAPDLAYYVLAFSMVVAAALALERLAQLRGAETPQRGGSEDPNRSLLARVPWIAGAVVLLAFIGALAAAGAAVDAAVGGASRSHGWVRFGFFAALIGGTLWLWSQRRIQSRTVLIALALITVADLWVIGRSFLHTVPPPEQIFQADDVVRFLRSQPQPNRVWALPQQGGWPPWPNYPMLHGIEQAGGEHGNQLQRWNEYVGAGRETYVDWHNFLQDPRFMDAANVRFLVSAAPVEVPWLREAYRGNALVYENLNALPRAFLVPQVETVADGDATLQLLQDPDWEPRQIAVVETETPLQLPETPLEGSAEVILYEPDRVVVRIDANREAFLVLADNMYEGWRAEIDGRELDVLRTNHTFRGVLVPAGQHQVEFTFRPAD
ncbi:MAG TPA: hypothetical protein VGW38_12285, partial [Chloroflexota bacterium]|nr:hypothetical protein [Chloroflexota bacterium]